MKAWAVALAVAAVPAVLASGQTPAPSPSPAPAAAPEATDPDPDSADLSFTATVKFQELKFDVVGTPNVEFKGGVNAPLLGGSSNLKTVWHAERINLPKPVQPGVVYREGGVRLTITTRFEDLARLLADPPPSPALPSPSPSPQP